MKKNTVLCALFVALGMLILVGSAMGAEKSYMWKIAHIRPAGSEIDKEITWFADEVREATNGRINIQIYGANQLGDYTVVQEKIAIGAVEMGVMSAATNVDKRLLAYTLQYVVPNYELAKKNYASGTPFANYIAEIFKKQDVKVLAYWPVYFGGIGLLKEPTNPEDPTAPKNLKVRVPTMKTWESLANAFGYQATPLPFSEFFTAAQTGIVEGIFGGGAENYHISFQDLIKCYIAANTHFECWPVTMNLELYESLSDADRELISAKAKELEARRWAKVETDQNKYVDLMEEAGTKVYRLDDDQLKAFAEVGRKASWGEFEKIVGEKVFKEITSTFVLQ